MVLPYTWHICLKYFQLPFSLVPDIGLFFCFFFLNYSKALLWGLCHFQFFQHRSLRQGTDYAHLLLCVFCQPQIASCSMYQWALRGCWVLCIMESHLGVCCLGIRVWRMRLSPAPDCLLVHGITTGRKVSSVQFGVQLLFHALWNLGLQIFGLCRENVFMTALT